MPAAELSAVRLSRRARERAPRRLSAALSRRLVRRRRRAAPRARRRARAPSSSSTRTTRPARSSSATSATRSPRSPPSATSPSSATRSSPTTRFAPDAARVTTLAGDERGALTFCLSGLSKLVGLPQLKLGWIVTGGPRRAAPRPRRASSSSPTPTSRSRRRCSTPRRALLALVDDVGAQIARARARQSRHARRARSPASPAQLLDAEGGWSAIVRLPSTHDRRGVDAARSSTTACSSTPASSSTCRRRAVWSLSLARVAPARHARRDRASRYTAPMHSHCTAVRSVVTQDRHARARGLVVDEAVPRVAGSASRSAPRAA